MWVQSSEPLGSKRQISDKGGTAPAWRSDGREIFYLNPDGRLMAAQFNGGNTTPSTEPKALFSIIGATGFAPTRDGNRFLVTMSDPALDPWPISIVLNWPAALKK